jgi:Tol biopolymer transport system component
METFRFLLIFAMTVSASTANSATGNTPPSPASDAIVFSRSQLNPDTTLRSSSLFVTDPTGTTVRPLMPMIHGVFNVGPPSWSPDGSQIAFARGRAPHGTVNHYGIYTVSRDGGHLRRLTSGPGSYHSPSWGPDNRIAFVSAYSDHQCLSMIDADGRNQRDLFCPPSPTEVMRPVWSADGASLYIAAGYYQGRLEPLWDSQAYLVDAASGATVLLTEQVLEEFRYLEFSPDGSRGIYSDLYSGEMTTIDFATDLQTPLAIGYAPRYSKDGRRIVFTQDVYGGAPDFLYYQPLFIMNANGSNIHRLTNARVDNLEYRAVDWSNDGTRVLVNRTIFIDPGLTIPMTALRIVNVNTGVVTRLPDGYAGPGAWFEH